MNYSQSPGDNQVKFLKTVANAGRATRFLGLFYVVIALIGSYSVYQTYQLTKGAPSNSQVSEFAKATILKTPLLLVLISGIFIGLFLFFAGTYIQKHNSKDTGLYLRLTLGCGILLILYSFPYFRIDLDLLLQALLIYYSIRGLAALKKVPADLSHKDVKKPIVIALGVIGVLLLLVAKFV